jgi:hypothetical protein
MEFRIFLKNDIIKKYTINDVAVMEDFPGMNNRWDETAIIFKDSSVFWEGGCFRNYVIDGTEFIRNNRVNTGGGYSNNKFEKIINIENYYEFVEEIKEKGTLVENQGTYDDEDYSFVWEVEDLSDGWKKVTYKK